jgi:hypothetical protein
MERLFGAIPEVLKGLGADTAMSDALVLAAWKECAGPLIIERTAAVEYFESRLVIAVSDATWRAHLEDLSPQMVARLNARLGQGTVKFIEFRVDPSAFRAAVRKAAKRPAPVAAEIPASLRKAADAISDSRLRDSFLAAAAAYLTK